MTVTKAAIDKGLTVIVAVTSAVDPIAVQSGWISSHVGTAIGAGIAAALLAYHGGGAAQSALTTPSLTSADASADYGKPSKGEDTDPSLASL